MSRTSSGTSTPGSNKGYSQNSSTSSYLSYPVSHIASSLYRRLTDPSPHRSSQPDRTSERSLHESNESSNGVYTPPYRDASPYQPPPLTPLNLTGSSSSSILTKAIAEEIRLLVPPRLQLAETWSLIYSLENDGVSLATLYTKCAYSPQITSSDASFVLVVQDGAGSIFGAYLTEAPRPNTSFYGTGECFLWKATTLPTNSLLANLPPPPSSVHTEKLSRSTTIAGPQSPRSSVSDASHQSLSSPTSSSANAALAATPIPTESIRFKAFPYSGINDYLIFCQQTYLSIGGGDGRYGLWLDGVLERGVSGSCLTFGNEPLSEEGEKFEVVGVEIWCIGGGDGSD